MLHGTALLGAPTTTAVRDQVPVAWAKRQCISRDVECVITRNSGAVFPANRPGNASLSETKPRCLHARLKVGGLHTYRRRAASMH